MKNLKDIKTKSEKIIKFTVNNYYANYQLLYDTDLVEDIKKADLYDILEYTLHRMLENNFTDDEIFFNSCMQKIIVQNSDDKNYIYIDLDYIIDGLILGVEL